MKHKSKARQEAQKKVLELLNTTEMINTISTTSPDDPAIANLVQQVCTINPNLDTLHHVIEYGLNLTGGSESLCEALWGLLQKVRESKKVAHANHREKRALASALGFHKKPKSVEEILQDIAGEGDECGADNVRIVWRDRDSSSPIALCSVLADTDCRPQENDVVVNESTGFYVVEPDESVFFLSKSPEADEARKIVVELLALRGVAQAAHESGELYKWASKIIAQACCERRNVRPTHDGAIVQLGWNAGPKHARVWGLAKSWNKKVDTETMVQHDEDAVALLTVCWSLAKASFPPEVIGHIEKCLEESGVPCIATRNISEGVGYRLNIDGRTYQFPDVTRAPPEGYMSQDYTAWVHTDKCWARYAVTWCIDRVIDKADTGAHGCPIRSCRSKTENRAAWPVGGGGNFVDTTLRVVIKQAVGTFILFQPDYPHGTTRLCGAHNRLCTITFSTRILEAYKIATQGAAVNAGDGAGHGDIKEEEDEDELMYDSE